MYGSGLPDEERSFVNVSALFCWDGEWRYDYAVQLRAVRDLDFELMSVPFTLYGPSGFTIVHGLTSRFVISTPGSNRPPEYLNPSLSDLPGAAGYLASRTKDLQQPTEVCTWGRVTVKPSSSRS